MAEEETEQVDAETQDDGIVGAVDEKAAELTGAAGAAATDSEVASNRGAVENAEQHLEENTDLADDRETLKKIQKSM